MKRLLINILFLGLVVSVFAQNQDEELAAQYYSNGEFDKAKVLYKKLHRSQPGSMYVYENYLNCLIALDEQKDAESLVNKQIKRYPRSFNYAVDLGYVYFYFKQEDKAVEHFQQLINDNSRDRSSTYSLAQSFQKRQYTEWAIKCYEEASENLGTAHFWQQLMYLYRVTGEFEKLTDLGLEVLKEQPRNLDYILRFLSDALENEASSQYVQSRTLLYLQKFPNHSVFDELLMRIYIQQKKFNAAYVQVVAMDKRNNEDGRRFLSLAQECLSAKAYDVAEKCYRSIIDKGEHSMFYIDGEDGILKTMYLLVTEAYDPDSLSIANVVNGYEAFLLKYGYNVGSAPSAKRLAEMHLFYSNDIRRAIKILEKTLGINHLHPNFQGDTKLMLADAYLIIDEIWEAKLLYGQVDKEFKEEPLGQEAKFRNARLSYFTGDFNWAKDQLDILKTATTQLVSNNAIELSILILDNTGLDSSEDAMKEYAHAQFLLFQNKIDECLRVLNMLPFKYPNHSLQDEIYFLKAEVMTKRGQFTEALSFYEKVYTNYSSDILADNALFKAAEIQQFVFKDYSSARSLYEQIILEYSSSLYVIESRKRYLDLKDSETP